MGRLFLDLDGVMADFDGDFPKTFGVESNAVTKTEMWKLIWEHGSYFRDMNPCPGALFNYGAWMTWHKPIILTACGTTRYWDVYSQKCEWVRKHLGVIPIIGVKDGLDKAGFARPGDILIDDWAKNTNAWEAAGGKAVLHTGDWGSTYKQFREHYYEQR